jgi:hypothetical protein
VENKQMVEAALKRHPEIAARRRSLEIDGNNYTELISIENLSLSALDDIIRDVARRCDCNYENYTRALDELSNERVQNTELRAENAKLREENAELRVQITQPLSPELSSEQTTDGGVDNDTVVQKKYVIVSSGLTEASEDANPIQWRINRQTDGYFHVAGGRFAKLIGSRLEVWNGIAYKSNGQLTRDAFCLNAENKIVSKSKHKSELADSHLTKYNAERNEHVVRRKNGKVTEPASSDDTV